MARLQRRAAGVLRPFVKGDFRDLSAEDCQIISAWTQMVVTTLESFDPPSAMIPASQRRGLLETSTPSEAWYVGIGRYVGSRHRGAFYHRAMLVPPASDSPEAISDYSHAQATIFALGEALFHAVSTDGAASFERLIGSPVEYGFDQGFRTVWPQGAAGDNILTFDDEAIIEIFDYFGGPRAAF